MRRLIQIAVLLLLLIHLVWPLFETVEHWDQFAKGGDDLVLGVLSVIAGLGLTLFVGFVLRSVLRPSLASSLLSFLALPEKGATILDVPRPENCPMQDEHETGLDSNAR